MRPSFGPACAHMLENDYVTRVLNAPQEVDAEAWNALLRVQEGQEQGLNPFMRHEYLAALHASGSATPASGWTPRWFTVWQGGTLMAACALYLKTHSYGEYVFDWAWARAFEQHGLAYYPKALVASPFTPVPGPRLLARDPAARRHLAGALRDWCTAQGLSSLHLLFLSDADALACREAGLMRRHTVQFHWQNHSPSGQPFADFEDFLASLTQEKRKKIRQERRKVQEAGVRFRWARGRDISATDWAFFYRCYERTYLEHGNAPYLTADFFARMAQQMPQHWLLFIAEREGQPLASSLIGLNSDPHERVNAAFGRYWGALERVDCLHFEACYYQPLEWCIRHGVLRFEGGAQGEHKMARALMPTPTHSAHWLAHPAFADAVERFLEREQQGIEGYLAHLQDHSPFRQA
jgi:predicted N-acyltransferase